MAEILIYEDIGAMFDGVTAKIVAEQLAKQNPGSRLDVRINTLGGAVGDGLAIRNQIRKYANTQRAMNKDFKVRSIVDGYAYSAGSIIALAADVEKGDEIIMGDGSMMMIHKAWTFAMGNADELRASADTLTKLDDNLADIYVNKSGKSKADIMALLSAETYFTAAEAVKAGFATSVDEAVAVNLAKFPEAAALGKGAKYESFMRTRVQARAADAGLNVAEWAAIHAMDIESMILTLP